MWENIERLLAPNIANSLGSMNFSVVVGGNCASNPVQNYAELFLCLNMSKFG